jgi:hypothetical protein
MDLRRSLRWAVLAVGTLGSAIALAAALGRLDVSALDEQGRALVAAGDYLPAARVLAQSVARAPGDARAHYSLGLAYAGLGLCGAAWFHLDEAARLAPAFGRPPGEAPLHCRRVARPDRQELYDHAVHRDRQTGGAHR